MKMTSGDHKDNIPPSLGYNESMPTVAGVRFSEDSLTVHLMDGRSISVPLVWYPRLLHATAAQRDHWKIAGGGYGIHWPDVDEDLSTEGLLRGAPAPQARRAVNNRTTRSAGALAGRKRSRRAN